MKKCFLYRLSRRWAWQLIGLISAAGMAGCPPAPLPEAQFTADIERGLGPLTVVFTSASNLHGANSAMYAWDFGGGAPVSTGESATAVFETPGEYTVSLTVTTDAGSDTETKARFIVVTEGPTALFDASPTRGPAMLQVAFTDLSTAGTSEITSWAWDFGDGESSADQNPTHAYGAPGPYDVTLTVTTAEGTSTSTKADFIFVTEGPTAGFSGAPPEGLGPLTVSFVDESDAGTAEITSWAWSFGDGTFSAEQNPTHVYLQGGTYDVTLTVTTADGVDDETKARHIRVYSLPKADFSASTTSGEAGTTVSFNNLSTAGTSPITAWAWSFGDGGTSDLESPSHVYTVPGNYDVSLTVTTAVGSDTVTRSGLIQILMPAAFESTSVLTGDMDSIFYGYSVGSAGDVNGDGYDDVIVGDNYFNEPSFAGRDEGKVYVYLGGPAGLNPEPAWTFTGTASFDWVGESVGGAGDVNNDGFDDVLVGALESTNGPPGTRGGAVRLYFGSENGLSLEAGWTYRGEYGGRFIGEYVGAAGDVNNDGYGDFFVGGYSTTDPVSYVFFGSPTLPNDAPDWAGSPSAIAGAGDVNGDGYDDVICGTYFDYGFGARVSVYYGSATGPSLAPDWTYRNPAYGVRIGRQMSTAGDVNGDGISDVIVGADSANSGGAALVFQGSLNGLSLEPDDILVCPDGCETFFGREVAGGTDFDSDGHDDVIVSGVSGDCGVAYVFFGAEDGIGDRFMLLEHECTSSPPGTKGSDLFGFSMSIAGDLDNDGRQELIVGNPMTLGPQGGRAHLYEYRPALPVNSR